jgi:tRNA-dihydrouridine synthase B
VHALPGGAHFRAEMNRIETTADQWRALDDYLSDLADAHERWPQAAAEPTTIQETLAA